MTATFLARLIVVQPYIRVGRWSRSDVSLPEIRQYLALALVSKKIVFITYI